MGWGSLAGGTDAGRQTQATQRVQAWRDVAAQDPGAARGLALALVMQAVVHEETGDPASADRALAECEALQHPLWPARLRRRCSWLPLTRMALYREDPALSARALALSHALEGELMAQGALREATLVQGQLALLMRLQGQPGDALAVLEQTAARQTAMGCEVDAGRSHGYACAAWLELEGADADTAEALAESAEAAPRALRLQAPYPTDIHHFIDALAWLAYRLQEPQAAALLLAGGASLRQAMQVGANALDRRLSTRVKTHLAGTGRRPGHRSPGPGGAAAPLGTGLAATTAAERPTP